MSFQKYPEYKDSGVEWLGDVPAHWEMKKLKHLVTCLDSQRIPLNGEQRHSRQGDVPYWGANAIMDYVDEPLFDEDLILLGEDGAPFFDTGRPVAFKSSGQVWPNNHIHVLRPKNAHWSQYIVSCLNSTSYVDYVEGSTRDKLTQSRMMGILLTWPPLEERRAITAFLDHETSRIDALVEEQQRLIEILKEKRQAVISHAVTKGLDPGVPMKDSGVEWLGEVPAHWEATTLKRAIASVQSGTSVNAADVPAAEGELGVLKTSCVYKGWFDWRENKTVNQEDLGRVSCPIREDALIVSRMNTPDLVGSAGLVVEAPVGVFLPDRLWQVSLQGECIPKYFYYFTRSPAYRDQVKIACAGTSSSMQNLGQEEFGAIWYPGPPEQEQQAIAAFLDHETARIDALVDEGERGIKLLQERRSALISAAVTGKIDVRGWKAEQHSEQPEVLMAAEERATYA